MKDRLRLPVFAIIYAPTLIFMAITVFAYLYRDVPISFVASDPLRTLHGHPLTGLQSNLGVLVWWMTGTICLFGSAILKHMKSDKPQASFLLWSGVITCVLTLDDLFQVHEDLIDRYLGLNERLLFLAYGLLIAVYLIRFRRIILATDHRLLIAAFVFFMCSLAVDAIQSRWDSPWRIFFEDGPKLLGIVSWSGYLIWVCYHSVTGVLTGQSGATDNAGAR